MVFVIHGSFKSCFTWDAVAVKSRSNPSARVCSDLWIKPIRSRFLTSGTAAKRAVDVWHGTVCFTFFPNGSTSGTRRLQSPTSKPGWSWIGSEREWNKRGTNCKRSVRNYCEPLRPQAFFNRGSNRLIAGLTLLFFISLNFSLPRLPSVIVLRFKPRWTYVSKQDATVPFKTFHVVERVGARDPGNWSTPPWGGVPTPVKKLLLRTRHAKQTHALCKFNTAWQADRKQLRLSWFLWKCVRKYILFSTDLKRKYRNNHFFSWIFNGHLSLSKT